jgi:hypothetical protein
MAEPHDELDDLLAPLQRADTPGLREAILARTQRRLAAGRWARRAGKLAGIAAVFAAGIGVGFWRAPRERETVLVPTTVQQTEVVTVPVPLLIPIAGGPTEPKSSGELRSAKRLELDAELADDAPSAAELYRRAGDAYLTAEEDYANAARCYRLFLARGGDAALSPEPGDSWLLTSLKNAAFKEKVHATLPNG